MTVVYPVEQEKYLLTIDPDSGELLSRRKSPKKMGVWHGIAELYGIRGHLTDENLTVRLPLLTVEETRLPAAGRYKRAKKLDKLPLSITSPYFTERRIMPHCCPTVFPKNSRRRRWQSCAG